MSRSIATRLPMLDAGRFVAAAAIVWLHTWMTYSEPITNVARFAVPFFAAAASYLMFQSLQRKPNTRFFDFAIKRVRRIYLPFLGWCVIYLIASNVKRHFVTHVESFPMGWSLLWAGSSLQLWFLPFLLIACLLFFPIDQAVARGMRKSDVFRWIVLLVLLAGGFAIAVLPLPGNDFLLSVDRPTWYFLVLSWGALPGFVWGAGLAVLDWRDVKRATVLGVCGAIALVVTMAIVAIHGRSGLLENLGGVGALLVALLPWDSAIIRRIAVWGTAAYGIYLSHALFLEGLFAFSGRAHIRDSVVLKFAEFFVVLSLSAVTVWILNRSKWTRWLNG